MSPAVNCVGRAVVDFKGRLLDIQFILRSDTMLSDAMAQNDTLKIAQEFLRLMGSNADAAEIANLFSEQIEWEIAGDTGALPWIGQKSGRAAITDFVGESRAMLERIRFDVQDIFSNDERAVILGSLASRVRRTSRIVTTGFALTVINGKIVRFQMLGDSFAVSRAARG
jgi:ketosteroid isomerase-like protein